MGLVGDVGCITVGVLVPKRPEGVGTGSYVETRRESHRNGGRKCRNQRTPAPATKKCKPWGHFIPKHWGLFIHDLPFPGRMDVSCQSFLFVFLGPYLTGDQLSRGTTTSTSMWWRVVPFLPFMVRESKVRSLGGGLKLYEF